MGLNLKSKGESPLTRLRAQIFGTPLGDVFAAVNREGALVRLLFLGHRKPTDISTQLRRSGYTIDWDENAVRIVVNQVNEYFARKRTAFDLSMHFTGTEFQREVWKELLKIPYGETISYGALAKRLGSSNYSRAVGRANGSNPIALAVPCHRVIGADYSLTGYGGGVDVKRALLVLEGAWGNPLHLPF
jgi:O-6-methylguanine DNA methyltransferase